MQLARDRLELVSLGDSLGNGGVGDVLERQRDREAHVSARTSRVERRRLDNVHADVHAPRGGEEALGSRGLIVGSPSRARAVPM